jgi:hypothetical protein
MRNSLSAMLIAMLTSAGSLMAISTTASAQSCKNDEIVATGRASLTEAGARRNAIENWRRDTLFRFGESWAEFERARDGSVGRCAHTSFGLLLRCEARGKPCEVPAGNRSPVYEFAPTTCRSSDSRNCNPNVKTMQQRLVAKGCRTKVDGAMGSSTSSAIRCFQQKARLTVTGNLDLETAKALNN